MEDWRPKLRPIAKLTEDDAAHLVSLVVQVAVDTQTLSLYGIRRSVAPTQDLDAEEIAVIERLAIERVASIVARFRSGPLSESPLLSTAERVLARWRDEHPYPWQPPPEALPRAD